MSQGYRLSAATGIHRGDRDYQQDQVLLLTHPTATGCVLAVVADGMGGRSGGRKASDQVMMTARQLFERYDPYTDDGATTLKQLAQEAHTVIQLTAISSEEEPHSTIAAFLINPAGDCYWVHVGDSRIYHYHGHKLVKRTKDHSYVQGLVSKGELTEAQANDHVRSNELTACLGASDDPPLATHFIAQLVVGDVLTACSDGIWHYFSAVELGSIISTLTPREASESLIDKARRAGRGAGDNMALVIVKLEPLDS